MTDNMITHVFDIGEDDFCRTCHAARAGWLPDVAGEIRAVEMLTADLDDHQRALLTEMREWEAAA